MQTEFDAHLPSADIHIMGLNLFSDSSAAVMAELGDIPVLQDVDANNDTESDTWVDYSAEWRDVFVIDPDGEMTLITNLTTDDIRTQEVYDRVKGKIANYATRNNVAATPWQNRVEPLDVTNDGFISPVDVLANVSEINTNGARQLDASPTEVTLFHDVDGDGWLAPKDVLRTVIHLNRDTGGSGEPPARNAATDAVFAALQAASSQDDDES